MSNNELFTKAVKAIDDYNKAVEMGFPQGYINKLDSKIGHYLSEIGSRGLTEAFNDYADI